MADDDRLTRHWLSWLVVPLAIGLLLGWLVHGRVAHACKCVPPTWHLSLERVESSDPAVDHTKQWPVSARLSGYPELFYFDTDESNGKSISTLDLAP